MEETGKQQGKEVENEDTSNSVKERAISPLHLVPTITRSDTRDSIDRDAVLARVESEKKLALVKAWEESEKTKAENRAYKRHNAVVLWENSKKASAEAHLKRIEEKLDRNKAKCVEKMQNKVAEIHRTAEEKRAMIEAYKGEEFLEIEEKAAKFRTRGYSPRKFLPWFGS
ncbi:remorin-like isoform X2 [Phaseolus vulgaris]|uniref:remorin-like isoform X2 n=1 Tax=Phaseolus vulgaris TaxID=3885 RepID=UPI0035CC5297